jgi:hypothetical protein
MDIDMKNVKLNEAILTLKKDRTSIKTKINRLIKEDDSKSKYKELIILTKKLSNIDKKLISKGVKLREPADPDILKSAYWENKLKNYKEPVKKVKKKTEIKSTKQDKKSLYNIMLCWTSRLEYCVCDSIITAIRDYLTKMGLEKVDSCSTKFIDKVEYCETYQITTTKDMYYIIINSAQ